MIGTLALNRVAALINRAIDYDPATRLGLAKLAGRTLALQCTLPAAALGMAFDSDGYLVLTAGLPEGADTRLKGTAIALAKLATNPHGASLAGSGVEMAGSQQLLQDLRAALATLDIDWEAALAALIGDVPAHLIASTARSGRQWQRQAARRAFSSANEYLQEEARAVLGHTEMAPWAAQVSRLAEDSDRLVARLNRLQQQRHHRVP